MIPADLRDGPMELEEAKPGVFVCPRHDDAAPRTTAGVCEWCAEEIADAEEEESSEDRSDRLSVGRYDTIEEREADRD